MNKRRRNKGKGKRLHIFMDIDSTINPSQDFGVFLPIPSLNPFIQIITIYSGHSNTSYHIEIDKELREIGCLRRSMFVTIHATYWESDTKSGSHIGDPTLSLV